MKYFFNISLLLLLFVNAFGFHDPTKPFPFVTKKQEQVEEVLLKLNMTFISKDSKIAVINGDSYSEGDVVLGKTIISIDADKVTVLDHKSNKDQVISSEAN